MQTHADLQICQPYIRRQLDDSRQLYRIRRERNEVRYVRSACHPRWCWTLLFADWVLDKGNIVNTNSSGGELEMILTESNGGTRLSSTRYVHYGTITARGESLINKDPRSSLMNIFQSKLVTGLVSLPHSSPCLPSKMKSIGNGQGIRLHKRKRTISGRAWFVSI